MSHDVNSETHGWSWWYALLLIPFIATLWLPFYARWNPTIAGIPFFYWYQFLWVFLSVLITAVVYLMVDEKKV